MSTAVFGRATSHPAAEAELPNPRSASGTTSTGAPQGGHVPGQEPGLANPHLVTRPMFYIHAPPPPFMHYQWPMPFYTPFSPFSGMGYGMMMPSFPPAPYMEPPAYFLPHAPVQPVDYRRMGHPQPHPNSAPYPSHSRRPRPPYTSLVRETVNSEVQTEPREGEYHGGSPLRNCSDSGRGTASNSPTSSTTSSIPKNSNSEGEKRSRAKEDSQLRITCTRGGFKPGSKMPNPGEKQSLQKVVKENSFVNSPSLKCRNLHLVRQENVETVDTPQKDRSDKERRVSVPDILMSWGNEMPQEDVMAADKSVKLPSYDDEVVNFQSSTVVNEELLDVEVIDGNKEENEQIADPKLCFEACEHSLNISIKLCGAGHDTINEATLEEPSESAQTASGKSRRKLSESIWSVESLPGFIPTKEWLAQNTTVGPEVIEEVAEEAENGCPSDEMANRKSRRNSSTDSVQMSDSFIGFSTPASKETVKQAGIATVEPMRYKLQKQMVPLDSPICDKSNLADTVKKVDRNETSEPASSPKGQSPTVEEKLEKNVELNKGITILLEAEKGSAEESSQKKDPDGGVEQLLVPLPIHAVMEVSPSKVDCGVQFPELQMNRGNMGMNRKQFHKSADFLNTSTRSEGYYGNGQKKRHFHFKGKGQDRPQSQQEAFYPHFERPGKPKGGKGRY